MESLLNDIRYGVRSLLKHPGFTAIAVLTLALGIGANTAIFSVVNATLLRPLPFKDPERVVMVWGYLEKMAQTIDRLPSSSGNFVSLHDQNHSLEKLAAFRSWGWQLTGGGEPELLRGARVSSDFFPAVGASPILGRSFLPEEDLPNRAPVAIISHSLWQRRFAADPNVIGKTMTLTGQNVMVVGVMPQGFQFPGGANMIPGLQFALDNDVWMPLALTDEDKQIQGTMNLAVIGRLKPGVSSSQAETELRTLQQNLPLGTIGYTLNVVPLHQQMVGKIRKLLLVLLATVAFVLLIACANIANLLLVRATSRQKETAIRAALGAGRLRLIRQLLTESLLLSLTGGALGLLLAVWGNSLLISLIPADVPRIHEINVDGRILAFTLFVSCLTGLVFGLAPALQSSKLDLNESLKEGLRGTTAGLRQNRLRSLLVVSEVAMALVVLISAALLIKSFVRLLEVKPGFNPANVLTMDIQLPNLPPSRYAGDDEQTAFFQQLMDRLKTLPGVESAGAVVSLPLSGAFEGTDVILAGQESLPDAERPNADYTTVTPDYFRALQIPLVKGRQFTVRDNKSAPGVIIINEVMAQRLWPNEDPLGKHFTVGFEKDPREIVGVVGNIRQTTLDAELRPAMYLPHLQSPNAGLTVLVRTSGEPLAIAAAVREQVRALDKDVPVTHIQTMDQVFGASVAQQRFSMLVVGLFAGLALVLASVGIYGVMAYSVAQRAHEIGVRMALGARTAQVLKLILKDGMTLALLGVGVGLAGAFALTRLIATLLFGVTPTDATTLIVVSLALLGVALVACYIPARRATKVDPLVALRYE
jgi:putative ABC transport system permease protein